MTKENIGIVTFPIGDAGYIPTSNLIDIFSSIANEVFVITGNKGSTLGKGRTDVHVCSIVHEKGKNTFSRTRRFIITQMKISYHLIKNKKNTRVWFFFIGGSLLFFPIITAKLLRKKVILIHSGSSYESFKVSKSVLTSPVNILETINRMISDHIILYSKNLINEWNLKKYESKISIASRHFLNFEVFNIKKNIDVRRNLVGFIGRLSEEKGISEFINAIPIVIKNIKDIDFLIVGDGDFSNEINTFIQTKNFENRVKFVGWVSHESIQEFLNELKLLVIPSFTEGLPNILLEAMACGTPVLATPVGAIPDIILNNETGFILSNNDPDNIALNIQNILNSTSLNRVVASARDFVEKNFTFSRCVKNYDQVIQEVLK